MSLAEFHPLRIEKTELFQVQLPLRHSFETSSHRKNALTHIIVRITAVSQNSEIFVGWGEIAAPAAPFYCAETTETCWHLASTYLAPLITGKTLQNPEDTERLWQKIRGHEFAKAGFSIALWDAATKAVSCSLATALGAHSNRVTAGVSLGIEPNIDALLSQVEKHVSAGYPRIKLKIAPGWDVEPVKAVREAFPAVLLHVDANGVYQPDRETEQIFKALDKHELTMFEQPFGPRDFLSHAKLQAMCDTPICLDESIVTLADLETMLHLNAGRILNIKVSRMGGLTVAKAAHDMALSAGVPVWCGGMHEFGIGRAANVALSALPGFTLPSDVSGSDKYYAEDLITPPVIATQGQVEVPRTPGIGYLVREERIRELATRSFTTENF